MSDSGGGSADADMTIQKALDTVRNSEGGVDPSIVNFLDQSIRELWARLEAAPDSYLMSREEFALFTYYRQRYSNTRVAESAVRRFWDNYHSQAGQR
jgi:hypothetical protein